MKALLNEASDLHRAIAAALIHEEAKRDKYGHPCGDAAYIARLDHARRRAADRWRRRAGVTTWVHYPEVHRAVVP